MTTAFSAVTAAIVAALQAAPAVSPQVHRARLRPMAADWTTAVVVRPLSADFTAYAVQGAPFNLDTQIAVECYARASAAQSGDVAVDAVTQAVYARLMADPALGGLVGALQPSRLDWDLDTDGEATACATFTFTVLHRAANNTLE